MEDFAVFSLLVMAAALVLLFLSPLIAILMQGLALIVAVPYAIFCFFKGLLGASRS